MAICRHWQMTAQESSSTCGSWGKQLVINMLRLVWKTHIKRQQTHNTTHEGSSNVGNVHQENATYTPCLQCSSAMSSLSRWCTLLTALHLVCAGTSSYSPRTHPRTRSSTGPTPRRSLQVTPTAPARAPIRIVYDAGYLGKDPEYDCTHPGQMARLGNPVSVLDYCLNDLEGHHTGGPPAVRVEVCAHNVDLLYFSHGMLLLLVVHGSMLFLWGHTLAGHLRDNTRWPMPTRMPIPTTGDD